MARTKETARRHKGTKAPRKSLSAAKGGGPRCFHDHSGREYTVLRVFSSSKSIPKLGIQVYLLGDRATSDALSLADKLLHSEAIEGYASNYRPRADVYTAFSSIEECVEHHRKEKDFRKRAAEEMRRDAVAGLSDEEAENKLVNEIRGREPLPHIVPSWCPSEEFWSIGDYNDDRYRSWIIVIPEDRLCWDDVVENGLLQVRFDLDAPPQLHVMCYWDGLDEDTLLDKDRDGWMNIERTGYEKLSPVDSRLLCVREDPYRNRFMSPTTDPEELVKRMDGWRTPGSVDRLCHVWSSKTESFRDCAYRPKFCDACENGEDHDVCEQDLNEHYFDQDGQCIACRKEREYRRRSKRIAARGSGAR